MTLPLDLRNKAREYRRERNLTIDEIAERLAVSRSTVYYWVRDMPPRHRERTRGQTLAAQANRDRCKALRDAAYEEGMNLFDDLAEDPSFRDFVCMYIGEGDKKSRGTVAVGNSDPPVVALATRWIRELSNRKLEFRLQYHADQDPDELVAFWSSYLREDPGLFTLQRKSNSNQMTGRIWRSRYGVLTVASHDTYLRQRLQAWMDRVRWKWSPQETPLEKPLGELS